MELYHHGVKGQKWGVRRYQNADGTLTAEGKERYGGQEEYKETLVRKIMTPGHQISKHREKKLREKVNSDKYSTEKKEKYEQKLTNLSARNSDRDAYDRHTSTGKLFVQNFLLGIGATSYRDARARGDSRSEAAVKAILPELIFPYSSLALNAYENKETYGRGAWSDSSEPLTT